MSRSGSFHLDKWYLDVVADSGEVAIGYAAKLRYGLLRLNCGALLHAAPGQPVRTTTQLTGLELPAERDGALHWTSPACHPPGGARGAPGAPRGSKATGRAHGTWSPGIPGPPFTLLEGPDGAVRWHGVHLRAKVRLTWPDGRTLEGLGYAERMELTIAPWRLPIRELRWGRFTAPGGALAWIDWRGSHPFTLVLHGAAGMAGVAPPASPVPGATVADDAIALPDGSRLSLRESLVLRDGTLGDGALRSVPLLRAVLPAALLGTQETKWRSRGDLLLADGRRDVGWAIHEVVRFPPGMDTGEPGRRAPVSARLGPLAYGAAFVLALPALLVSWARGTAGTVPLPLPDEPVSRAAGAVLVAAGGALMLAAMRALAVHGGGLPMNAFPPPRFVARGPYRLCAHPIYVGFVAVCAGVALLAGSASGLWLVTPAVALGCAALVLGYEGPDLTARFGAARGSHAQAADARPFLALPPAAEAPPTCRERCGAWLLVLVAWTVAYEGALALGVPARHLDPFLSLEGLAGLHGAWTSERAWPVLPWTAFVYASVYPAALLGALLPRTARELRELALRLLWSFLAAGLVYLALPFVAEPRPFAADGVAGRLLAFDRALDAPTGALPALHATWALLLAAAAARRWRRARVPVFAWGWAVAASCVTTGQHALLDVLAGAALAWLVVRRAALWQALLRATEAVANSWREWRLGPLRVINHGAWAALGAALGLLLARQALPVPATDLATLALAGLVGAGLWAQFVEGSPSLLRPFGYYGGVLGVGLGGALLALAGRDPWPALAALALAAPWIQACGRLRCLVQGCCHGRPCRAPVGIRYRHPRSRVVTLARLGDAPVYPTPLYSILTSVATGALLARLWWSGADLPLLGGCYLMLNGLCRFVEEAYRGEPQTPRLLGLPLYQWSAVAAVLAGAALTTLAGAPAGTPLAAESAARDLVPADAVTVALATGIGVLVWLAMGVDFPESNRRFSRLA